MTATTIHPTVESYAKKYPDVPKEVILKEDLLRLGLNVTRDAMELSKGCREQAYYLFSYNISSHDDLAEGVSTVTPASRSRLTSSIGCDSVIMTMGMRWPMRSRIASI